MRALLMFSLLALAVASPLQHAMEKRDTICPTDWLPFEDSCYYFSVEGQSKKWHDASTYCNGVDAELAVPNSNAENEFLSTEGEARQVFIVGYTSFAWWSLGCHDTVTEGVWVCVDGTLFSTPGVFKAWQIGEPNQSGDEDCMTLDQRTSWPGNTWNDLKCDQWVSPFICEKKGDTAHDHGDPHLKTFDGRPYSFQGLGWFTMVKDCTNEKPQFEITAQFQLREDSTSEQIKSKTVAINVTVGDEYVIVDGLNVITGNGNGLVSKPKDIHIQEDGKMVKLEFTSKDTTFELEWTLKRHMFDVTFFGSAYDGKLCGLLGNADGESRNDFQKPDGTVVQDAVEFGESWKVQGKKM